MNTRITGSLIAGLAALALAGCGTSDEPTVQETAEPTAATTPTLKVPTVASGKSASVIVNGGELERGTKATVYAFEGGWDRAAITCDDTTAESREVTLTGDGSDQTVPFPVSPGIVGWVMVAGDFSTPCNGEGSTTTVKVAGQIDVLTDKEPSPVAAERPITIWAKGGPETVPATVTVQILGPWDTLPEAQAADCGSAPTVTVRQVEIEPSATGSVSDQYQTSFTPDATGIYRLVASMPETEQSTAVDTCSEDAEPKIFVVQAK